jgi:hypothetical protein
MDPAPIVVVVPHRLGKAEATRRVKASIDEARTREAAKLKVVEEKWDDNGVRFRVALLGLPCTGTIEIGEDRAKAEVNLSWYQSHLLKPAEAFIQQQGQQIFSGP